MTRNEESTLDTFEEDWVVTLTSREEFTLSGAQAQIIRQADAQGMRGMVHFEKFSISIPHIVSMTRTRRVLIPKHHLLEQENKQQPMDSKSARKRIAEIKRTLQAKVDADGSVDEA